MTRRKRADVNPPDKVGIVTIESDMDEFGDSSNIGRGVWVNGFNAEVETLRWFRSLGRHLGSQRITEYLLPVQRNESSMFIHVE